MSGVRVTYSGLISFSVGLIGVFTGLVFTLIITRELSQEEFGTWSLIGGLTAYVLIFEQIISYWTTREIARNERSGKTAMVSGGMFSLGAIPLYFLIIILFVTQADVDKNILLFGVILVPALFFRHILAAINFGYKPQIVSYGLLAFELTKIPAAVFLIYFLNMGVYGAIITAFVAAVVSIIIQIILSYEKIKGEFNFEILKKWLKLFWLPTYPRISEILSNSDIIIFILIIGVVEPLAFWASAMAVAGIILHSAKISKAIYPKLLGGGKKEFLQENLIRVFYFSIPLIAISMTFARPALFALNPIYEIAVPIVWILSILVFLRMLSNVFTFSISGIERVDTKENVTFMDYIKSKLFFLPTLRIIQRGGYLAILATVLLLIQPHKISDVYLVTIWAVVALVSQIPYTVYLFVMVQREFKPKIDLMSISKYIFASVISFGTSYLLMNKYLVYKASIFEFLPEFIQFLALGTCLYLVITYLIDFRTRKLTKLILQEIKK
jgi:O-antigen/teichoic acid export membrane protein